MRGARRAAMSADQPERADELAAALAALAAQQAHNRRLLALTQLVTSLSTLPDPTRMVDQISAGLLDVLAADAVLLWLYNTAAQRYMLSAVSTGAAESLPDEERENLMTLMIRSG